MIADLSGSTPLGERLDPEDLRRILGGFFRALTHEIHERRGVIDKFVGDAVRASFAGGTIEDTSRRALSAGLAMLDALARENEALERAYGVRLSLRIGVNSGEVLWSGAGAGDPRQPNVGRTIAIAQRLESTAIPNTVHVGEPTYRAARRVFQFEAAPLITVGGPEDLVRAYRLAGVRHAVLEGEGARSATTGETSASLQVGEERAHLLEEQRKLVTVLFADLAEPIADRIGPEALRQVLGMYFSAVSTEIRRYGGTIDKFVGDAVMAVFGAPLSHEDDAARAIRAALGIVAAVARDNEVIERAHGVRVVVRAGINTGEVVAGLLPGEVVAYTITGDAVNTAQRIESATPAGQIYVSSGTRSLARASFVYEPVPPLTLKGKSAPVEAFRVVGPERRASHREGVTLVGREAELARLYSAFREAAAGNAGAVHLYGEAGVGKTRLVGEFLSGLAAAGRVRSRASSYEQATPYALVAEVFRHMFGISAADTEEVARGAIAAGIGSASDIRDGATALLLEILGYGVESPLDPQGKRRLAVSLLRQTISYRAQERPLVLVIEDLHWTDPTSGEVLATVAASIGGERCLILSTAREATDARWPAEAIALETLPAAAAEELVDRLAATALEPATRALIVERTGGNPFFIEEVMRTMRGGAAAAVPATVQDLLEARLDALDADPRRVAHAASVVGRTFWERIVARVTPEIDISPALEALRTGRLINETARAPELTYSFTHVLVQEVAYRTQLISQRRRAHVAVGDAFGSLFHDRLDEFVDTLAFHYRRGDDDPKARTWLLRAGHRAQRLYANTEAVDYFTATLERSGDDSAARAEALEALGDVVSVIGRYDEALERYATADVALGDDAVVARARLRRKTAVVHRLRGKVDEALALIETALADLPADEAGERARASLVAADMSFRAGRHGDAHDRLVFARSEAQRAGDDEALAESLKQLGTLHAYQGDLEGALRFQQDSLAAYERIGDVLGQANVQNNIGRTERRMSRHGEALDAYRESLAIRERIGDQLGRVHSHGNIAEIHFLRGELADAQREYEAVRELSSSIGYSFGVSAARVGLGATMVARGQSPAAIPELEAAIEEFERAGQKTYTVEALRDLTDAFVGARSPRAVEAAERAVRVAREIGLDALAAIALQALGRANVASGDGARAAAALEESRALLGTTGDRHELARTFGLLGRAYAMLPSEDPRSSQAAALTGEARGILTDLGAALDLQRLEAGWI